MTRSLLIRRRTVVLVFLIPCSYPHSSQNDPRDRRSSSERLHVIPRRVVLKHETSKLSAYCFRLFSNSIHADDWCTANCDNGNLGSLSETGLHLSLLEMEKVADQVDNNDKQKEGSDKVSTEYGKLCWAYMRKYVITTDLIYRLIMTPLMSRILCSSEYIEVDTTYNENTDLHTFLSLHLIIK